MTKDIPDITLTGFNPCFSGSCIRISLSRFEKAYTGGFNPCFSGSCIRILTLWAEQTSQELVSILVLVDLAFEFGIMGRITAHIMSFNPCFSGSCIRIRIPVQAHGCIHPVSILVLVDLAFESCEVKGDMIA